MWPVKYTCIINDNGILSPVLDGLKKQLQVLRGMNSADKIIKAAITEAIAKELNLGNTELVEEQLSKIHQKGLISSEIFEWAIAETRKEQKQILTANNVRDRNDTPMQQGTPVELYNDDLYHASLCSTVINKSSIIDAQECKRLLQSSSHRSLIKFAVTQPEDQAVFPKCMIAVYSDDSQGTTCYLAFADFKFHKPLIDLHNSTFGKGMI